MSKWFIQQSGQVEGPYSNEEISNQLQRQNESELDKILVWKRGLSEWIKASKWNVEMASPYNLSADLTQTGGYIDGQTKTDPKAVYPNSSAEKTAADTFAESAFYRVQLNFVDQPLMSKPELLTFISKLTDVSKLSIQNPKTKEWNEVFAYPDIVERLGLSRRKHSRVPILAQFTGKTNKHEQFNAKIVTISQGGVGFTEVFDLKIGDFVEGQIMSPQFFQPIHIKADVIYSGLDGYIGLKFTEINDESVAAIIDYVKKFGRITQTP